MLCAVLVAVAAGLALLFRRSIALTLPVAGCAIILLAYLCTLCGLMPFAHLAVLVLGAAALVYCALAAGRDKSVIKSYWLSPALFIFLGLALVLAFWGQRGRLLFEYDEFSHWGRVVKSMFLTGLPGNQAGVLFPHYPPGASLWQYLAVKLGTGWSEGALTGAHVLLLLTTMMPALAGAKARWALPLAAIGLALPLSFYPAAYKSLYVDPLLAMLLGCALYMWFSAREKDAFLLVAECLLLFTLALVKDSGSGIALLALGIIAADALLGLRRQKKAGRQAPAYKKALLGLGAMGASVLAARYSWVAYLRLTSPQHAASGGFGGSLGQLGAFLAGDAEPWRYTTLQNFVKRFLGEGMVEHILPMTAFLLLFLVCLAAGFAPRWGLPRSWRVLAQGGAAACLAYVFSMLVMYVFMFNEYEAVPLHSWERYLGSWVVGWVYALLLVALRRRMEAAPNQLGGRRAQLTAWGALAGVLLFASPAPLAEVSLTAPLNTRELRQVQAMYTGPAQRAAPALAAQAGQGATLAVVIQQGDAYVSQALSYHMLPHSIRPYRLGAGAQAGIPAMDISAEEWALELAGSGEEWLYLFSLDEDFAARYGQVFGGAQNVEEGAFYRVVRGHGTAFLEKADI